MSPSTVAGSDRPQQAENLQRVPLLSSHLMPRNPRQPGGLIQSALCGAAIRVPQPSVPVSASPAPEAGELPTGREWEMCSKCSHVCGDLGGFLPPPATSRSNPLPREAFLRAGLESAKTGLQLRGLETETERGRDALQDFPRSPSALDGGR